MDYKKKVTVLSAVIGVLALAYALTLIFDPARRMERSDAYTWLKPADIDRVSRISISRPETQAAVEIARGGGGDWQLQRDGRALPAKQTRVSDFLAELAKQGSYPTVATSTAAHERLSVTEETATRITLSGDSGQPVLDILIGQTDTSGKNAYIRRADSGEVRSGENRFSPYTGADAGPWLNLRLFPKSEEDIPALSDVMRLRIEPADGEAMVFTRAERTWQVNFAATRLNPNRVDVFVKDILSSTADGFADSPEGTAFDGGRVVVELADGTSTTISFSAADENGKRFAQVSGTGFTYSLSGWMYDRFFLNPETFELPEAEAGSGDSGE